MVGLCRLCASLRKHDALTTIKDDSSEICQKLRKCCQLDININDCLPKSVCHECVSNLNNSYKFYSKVRDAQEALQALYPSPNFEQAVCEEGESEVKESKTNQLPLVKDNTRKLSEENYENTENSFEQVCENHIIGEFSHMGNGLETEINQTKHDLNEMYELEKTISEDSFEILEESAENVVRRQHSVSNSHNVCKQQDRCTEDDQVSDDNVQYSLVFENAKDTPLEQINERGCDSDVEIEYFGYYEDYEEGSEIVNTENDGQTLFNTTEETLLSSTIPSKLNIESWKNYKYNCFICDKVFDAFINLKKHIAQEHNITQKDKFHYKCYNCKEIIPRYNIFLNHVRSKHHPDLKLKCDVCDLSFQNFQELSYHRSINCTETNNYPYIIACNECFKSFHNTYGLENHKKLKHNISKSKDYKCTQCNREFQYKNCLRKHQQLHSGTDIFLCKYCERFFDNEFKLDKHHDVHAGENGFQCNICKKR